MGGQKGGLVNEKGHFPAVCNKSFQAQASDMQGAIDSRFFAENDLDGLRSWTPRQLERSGRLVQPLYAAEGASHYQPISWDEALQKIEARIRSTPPEQSFFYFSGRSSNEAGFLLQLFARMYGTNNVNNCSYYCHQASGVGLTQSLGTGTATINLEDLDHTDLIFLWGANPPSNHPRFMHILMEIRRRGGRVIVVNPARERGLENFAVPSDFRSLLFGSEIASTFIQPHIGGDIALGKGIAKSLFELAERNSQILESDFITANTEHFEAYQYQIQQTSWQDIESESGVPRSDIEDIAQQYASAKNVVFAWAMGLTHHAHGVGNVQSLVNLALLRGMVGRRHAGLLPLRGHSNVQGIGSVGVTPQLKKAFFDNLESYYKIRLPTGKGMDTLACMESANKGEIDFAWNLGGNLYGSNPDAMFAQKALRKIGFVLYMNTTLNQGHFRGMGKETLILPVLARDEEPQATTQESMFNFVRMSDGGHARHSGPMSEVNIISAIAHRIFPEGPIPWQELGKTSNIRKVISGVIPGFESMQSIDETRKEFHISGRILHEPQFATSNGKARFTVCDSPDLKSNSSRSFKLMTVRSEGQFNTVVYEEFDKYRGIESRDVVLMNAEDIQRLGFRENDRVRVQNDVGAMGNLKLLAYPIKSGNIMMYYPESNVLVPRQIDEQSRTPSFKSVDVEVMKEG